ncbi:ornithine cyclodeaminase family protein [Falsihalocynthiibacter arcticus]|uniref:ornithine cyclodeaminase family protein n=1 Tax=Falsihalocynthiibacter arcticus TaxID=1579316 RepID=UPI003001736A
MLRVMDADETRAALPWSGLIDGLEVMFKVGCEMPLRHHHAVAVPNEDAGTLLLMPAWTPGAYIGVKMVTVIPGNSARGLPAISGAYLLSSGATGALLAVLDGAELTARRTAAASALAARYLARADASRLLVVGAGKLALNVIEAHSTVRSITSVTIWARRLEQAEALAAAARAKGFDAVASDDLETAVRGADIITCCTLSRTPLVLGDWVQPGTHIDLIGAFKPDMRETDSAAVAAASVFADTHDGVVAEGGDIVQAIAEGAITEADIQSHLV